MVRAAPGARHRMNADGLLDAYPMCACSRRAVASTALQEGVRIGASMPRLITDDRALGRGIAVAQRITLRDRVLLANRLPALLARRGARVPLRASCDFESSVLSDLPRAIAGV